MVWTGTIMEWWWFQKELSEIRNHVEIGDCLTNYVHNFLLRDHGYNGNIGIKINLPKTKNTLKVSV